MFKSKAASLRLTLLKNKRSVRLSQAAFAFLLLVGCSTYQNEVQEARYALSSENPSKAAALLQPKAEAEGRDQLVYLLDYATALQQAKRFKESAAAFQKAEKIADIQDYHSITNVTSSLVLSEDMVQYKGDDYEKVLINAMNAVNYIELGDLDGALVEVRRLNQKLYKFKYEAKKDYEQNPFAYYLGAILWEADRKWDDAYIAYKNAYELMPNYSPLREDLIRAAIKAQRSDELEKWQKQFPEVKIKPEWKDKNAGEIVFIYQQGWGPRKKPRPESPRFPQLFPVRSLTQSARLTIDPIHYSNSKQGLAIAAALFDGASKETLKVFSVTDVAVKTLDDDYARLIASRVGGVVAKAVLAEQLRQNNEALGQIAWIAMNIADQADVRQWSTLPESFQIARIPAKAGKYKIRASGIDLTGNNSGEEMPEREVEVKPGQKAFVTWRSVR